MRRFVAPPSVVALLSPVVSPALFASRMAVALAALALACTTAPADPAARSVRPETWERVRPHLEALKPGDDLRIFRAARQVYGAEESDGRPMVVIPSWIPSLSGGAAGGVSMFGQLIGRRGKLVYGSHVFGYVSESRIVPRFQVITRAQLTSAAEVASLAADGARDVGALPRPTGVLHFKDLLVAGTRPLDFELPRDEAGHVIPVADDFPDLHSEATYRRVAAMLDAAPIGTDLLSLLWLLEARFVTEDAGQSHRLVVPGFLQTREARTRTVEEPTAIYKLRPFGYLEGTQGVVRRIAIFENDRLRGVVRYDGRADWLGYLRELGLREPAGLERSAEPMDDRPH